MSRYDWEDKAKAAYKPGRQSSKGGEQPGLRGHTQQQTELSAAFRSWEISRDWRILAGIYFLRYNKHISLGFYLQWRRWSILTTFPYCLADWLCLICIVRRISIVQLRTYMCISVSPHTHIYCTYIHTHICDVYVMYIENFLRS